MKKILITGGAVHAHIDAVKIVTNKFKGGLIADLADKLYAFGYQITYLTSKHSVLPLNKAQMDIVFHEGFTDYQEKTLSLAPLHDAAIIGAAVANLIPADPWKGKFPSHNYSEGDVVQVPFLVTPRVITKIKEVAPNITLIGCKLLSGAPYDELINAAWHTLTSSKALAVIANDATDLQKKHVITKEGGVHHITGNAELALFINQLLQVTYYRTEIFEEFVEGVAVQEEQFAKLIQYADTKINLFESRPPYKFGTVALRLQKGFLTTGRGKEELGDIVRVLSVDHNTRTVYSYAKKASLNAPLLDWIFRKNPGVVAILHGHRTDPTLNSYSYAVPGTIEDSTREVSQSFNILGHGCFYLLTQADLDKVSVHF